MGKQHESSTVQSSGDISNPDSRSGSSTHNPHFSTSADQNAKEKKQAQTDLHDQFKEAEFERGKPYGKDPQTGAHAAE